MKHILCPLITLALFCCTHFIYAYAPKNQDGRKPSVALVLAGGGAKGAAHVGAIRVIEQAGIPIDYVVGTSMGALIGALYSVGYTPNQMDSILKTQDWKVLLSDRENPINETLDRRLLNDQYTISFPFKAGNPGPQKGGFIEGVNIGHLFHQLISPYTNDICFDSLPIPFACVAVDIVSGQPHEFHRGSLQQAMRASMAIPAVFTPVRKDSMVLVDGGIMNNYPSDVARQMGADIIIGVDVQASLLNAEHLVGVGNVLQQVIDVATNNDYFEKIDDTDIYIKVDVSGYTAASFSSEAIDTLLIRGETAAQNRWEDLMELRQHLDLMGRAPFRQRLPKPTIDMHQSLQEEMAEKYSSSSIQKTFAESSINLSVRYDNIEKVSLLMGLHLKLPTQKEEIYYDIRGRLGNRSYIETRLNWNFNKQYNLCAAYQFQNDETDLYVGRKLYANINYYRHYARIESLFSWKNIYFRTGFSFNHYNWNGLISLSEITSDEMHTFNYYIKGQYSTLDDQWFPTKGSSIYSDYQIITSNLRNYRGHTAPRIISARLSHAYSFNRRLTLIPSASLRILKHPHNSIFAFQNFLGGIQDALIFEGQQTFAGITRIQVAQNALLTSGFTLRGRISRNQYLLCGGAIACQGKYAETIFDKKASWGARMGYSYKSLIGPLSASAHYSDISKELSFLVNIGYIF